MYGTTNCRQYCISVLRSQAPDPDIFFRALASGKKYQLRLQPEKLDSDWLRLQKTDIEAKHLKNLYFNKKNCNKSRFCPKNGKKTVEKRCTTQSKKNYLV